MTISPLKVVVLHSPYDNSSNAKFGEMFWKLLGLKLAGYRAEYPYGVMPIDATDFIATQTLVCKETLRGLIPLMAYRSVELSKALIHNMVFGGVGLAKAANSQDHLKAVELAVSECQKSGREISYDSSWTIAPEARQDRELTRELRAIMQAIHILYHVDFNIPEIIAGGVNRFKMERLYHYWGYKELELNGKVLPTVKLPFVFDEEVTMFHLKKFSDQALKDAETFRGIWNARVEIGEKLPVKTVREAA